MTVQGEIIAIGDELLCGRVINTTSSFAARQLVSAGYSISKITIIGDKPEDIKKSLLESIDRAAFILVTGGLGPTTDDITNEVVADALGLKLVLNEHIMNKILAMEKRLGLDHLPMREKLAWLPEGAELLNPEGSAAGYMLSYKGIPLFFLPGVPSELEDHIVNQVLPRMEKLMFNKRLVVKQHIFRVFGLQETDINTMFLDIEPENDDITIGYYPNFPEVHISVTVKGKDANNVSKTFTEVCKRVRGLLRDYIVAEGEETLESVLGNLLREKDARLSLAESCTGGLIASRITRTSGASEWFDHAVVSYSNSAKENALGVSHDTISKYGAVSYECCMEMLKGVSSKTEYGLAVTGIAGPSGGSEEKPTGTVYIGLKTPDKYIVEHFWFPGNRNRVQEMTAETALDWLRRYLVYGTYVPGYRPVG